MSERKKRYSQKRALTGAQTCKLWPKSNNTTNVLRPRRFKWFDLFQNVIRYCSMCSTLSTCQVFFPKCYFNKVCFELPENLT